MEGAPAKSLPERPRILLAVRRNRPLNDLTGAFVGVDGSSTARKEGDNGATGVVDSQLDPERKLLASLVDCSGVSGQGSFFA